MIEFERVESSASLDAGHEAVGNVSGLLPFAVQEERGWQGQALELYDALRQGLYRYLRGLGLMAETAEDVIQESFLRLAAHLRAGGDAGNLKAWVFQVAYNLSMDVHRTSRRDHAGAEWQRSGDEEQADPSANPERMVLENERQHRVRSAISQLTPRQRRSILLRADGLRYKEIASMLGVSEQRAMHLVKRSVARLSEGL